MSIIKLLYLLSNGNPRSLIISNGFANTLNGNGNTWWMDLLKINNRFVKITRFPFATSSRFSADGQNGSVVLYNLPSIWSYGFSFSNQSEYSSRPPAFFSVLDYYLLQKLKQIIILFKENPPIGKCESIISSIVSIWSSYAGFVNTLISLDV